jgi:UDP-N-acetylmuramate--alanine ligase
MSGIAEVLANQGFEVSGSDLSRECHHAQTGGVGGTHRDRTRMPRQCGAGRCRGGLDRSDATTNPEVIMARLAPSACSATGTNAGGTDAHQTGYCHCGHARQNHDNEPGGQLPGRRRIRPDIRDWWPLGFSGCQREAGRRVNFWWQRQMNRMRRFYFLSPVISVVTNIDADHMETYGHDFGTAQASLRGFFASSALLWRGRGVRG